MPIARALQSVESFTTYDKPQKYPHGVFFILGNGFFERYSFYSFATLLKIYLSTELGYSAKTSTMIYNGFMAIAFSTPIFGAIMGDSWIGKYRTVLIFYVPYIVGLFAVSIGAIPMKMTAERAIFFIGLFSVMFGAGGTKPCAVALGADQFTKRQPKRREQFFSIYYLAINFGSLSSTFLTLLLKDMVFCFGKNSCFLVGFGIPAIMQAIALFMFVLGRSMYKIRPAQGTEFVLISKCIWHALCRKVKSKGLKKRHWLDYADDKYDKAKIRDIKSLLNIAFIFLPLPVFWALFNQLDDKLELQGGDMDDYISGFLFKPDQIQIVNSLMVVILIPLFELVIYPLLAKVHLLQRPLERMMTGGLFAAFGFIMIGLIQVYIEHQTTPDFPTKGFSEITVINNSPCNVALSGPANVSFNPFHVENIRDLTLNMKSDWTFTPSKCAAQKPETQSLTSSAPIESMMIYLDQENLNISKVNDTKEKPRRGYSEFRIFFSMVHMGSITAGPGIVFTNLRNIAKRAGNSSTSKTKGITEYVEAKAGKYDVLVSPNNRDGSKKVGQMYLRNGARYIFILYQNATTEEIRWFDYEMVKASTICILLQLVPMLLISAGEVMFSITGLAFSYSQTSASMKSLAQAAWLLTIGFGSVLVLVITNINPVSNRSSEFFLYSVLMALDVVVFGLMSYFFKYSFRS